MSAGRCKTHLNQQLRDRGTTTQRGLGADWRKVRAAKLLDEPLCQIQLKCGKGINQPYPVVATEVDHIIPRHIRPDLRLEWSNLQSACKSCNSAKRDAETGGDSRKTEPISGESSQVLGGVFL